MNDVIAELGGWD